MIRQQKEAGLKQKVPEYLHKIHTQAEFYESEFEKVREYFLKEMATQVDSKFKRAKQDFNKHRKPLDKELVTLQYYAQHPQENHNLYPLYNQISDKIIYNTHLIHDTRLTVTLPAPDSQHLDLQVLNNKINILDNYLKQLTEVVRSDNVRKYCKKQFEASNKIVKTYDNLLQNAKQTLYSSQVKLERHFEEVVVQLGKYKHVERMFLSMRVANGILVPASYHALINSLSPNRSFLTKLTLRLMDMQFSQEKCDIIRKRLCSQFKHLKTLSIHNYYKECKLGMFEDFNWHPYRRQINITSSPW